MKRRDLTAKLIELLPDQDRLDLDEVIMKWWINPTANGGFRLTSEGYTIMSDILEFEHWVLDAPTNLKLLLELEKKLTTPYYVDNKKRQLILFGSKEAMMANLHGSIKRWLELLDRRPK